MSRRYFKWHWRCYPTSIVIEPSKPIRLAVISDVHAPYQDETAISLAIKVLTFASPCIIIIAGDFMDFFAISRFSKDPRRRLMLADELKVARELLHRLHNSIDTQLWIYLEGNHEERLRLYLWNKAAELSTLDVVSIQSLLQFEKWKDLVFVTYQDEPKPMLSDVVPCVRVGNLLVIHGDRLRLTGNAINVALNVFRRLLRNVLVGHFHRADFYVQTDYDGKMRGCWLNPCLSLPRPHWDAGRIWSQGLSIVEVNVDGFFKVDVVPFIRANGKVIAFWGNHEFWVKAGDAHESAD